MCRGKEHGGRRGCGEAGWWLHVWLQERSFVRDGRSPRLRSGRAGQTCFVACLIGGRAGVGVDRSLIRRRGEFGETGGSGEHALPLLELKVELVFLFDVVVRVEHELGNVGESGGIAMGDALLGESLEELAKNKVDVSGGEEVAGERGGEFRAEASGFEELHFVTGVEEAEGRVVAMTKHAAATAVGSLEGAAVGGSRSGIARRRLGRVLFGHFHKNLPKK